jgi:hypothetical protein
MKPLFNPAQRIALESYCGGEFDYLLSITKQEVLDHTLRECGDTLLAFIVKELADSEDCENTKDAIRRLDIAVSDINEVLNALERVEEGWA